MAATLQNSAVDDGQKKYPIPQIQVRDVGCCLKWKYLYFNSGLFGRLLGHFVVEVRGGSKLSFDKIRNDSGD